MNSPKLTGLGIHEQTILTMITAHHPRADNYIESYLGGSVRDGSLFPFPNRGEFL